jgi:hypothetical protein
MEKPMEKLALKPGPNNHTYWYHTSQINKCMALDLMTYAFDGEFENRGDGIKLGLFGVQLGKVALKAVCKDRYNDEGGIHYNGAVLRQGGNVYMVDVDVAGPDKGTSKDPRFSIFFEDGLP